VIEYNNAAICLYKKLGFEELGYFEKFYLIDNQQYNSKLFGLFVNGGKKKIGWKEWIYSFFDNP
jgi:RimJ/RimL family protein N-acetyltransferase